MTKRFEYLQQLLANSPQDPFLLFAMAKEFEGQGDADQALAYYLQLQQADPGYVGLYYHLGKLHEKAADFSKAVQVYKQGIEIARKSGDQHAASELMGALMNLEDPDEE